MNEDIHSFHQLFQINSTITPQNMSWLLTFKLILSHTHNYYSSLYHMTIHKLWNYGKNSITQ